MGVAIKGDKLLFKFKADTVTTVSRASVLEVAKVLGFDATQTLHFALARLRDEVRRAATQDDTGFGGGDRDYPPLTAGQLLDIRMHAPPPQGKLISKKSLF